MTAGRVSRTISATTAVGCGTFEHEPLVHDDRPDDQVPSRGVGRDGARPRRPGRSRLPAGDLLVTLHPFIADRRARVGTTRSGPAGRCSGARSPGERPVGRAEPARSATCSASVRSLAHWRAGEWMPRRRPPASAVVRVPSANTSSVRSPRLDLDRPNGSAAPDRRPRSAARLGEERDEQPGRRRSPGLLGNSGAHRSNPRSFTTRSTRQIAELGARSASSRRPVSRGAVACVARGHVVGASPDPAGDDRPVGTDGSCAERNTRLPVRTAGT